MSRVTGARHTHECQSERNFYQDGGKNAGPGMAGEELEDPESRKCQASNYETLDQSGTGGRGFRVPRREERHPDAEVQRCRAPTDLPDRIREPDTPS